MSEASGTMGKRLGLHRVRKTLRRQNGGLLIALLLLLACVLEASALSFADSFVPPEIVYAHALSQRVALPGRPNINKATLQELQLLPGVDESLALKLMRLRPLRGFADLYRMPALSQREIQLLIEQLRNRVEF